MTVKGILAKTAKAVLWAAGAMVFPFSISLKKNALHLGRTAKRLAMYAFGWNVLVPGAVLFAPRMERELEAQGLDPRLAAETAPGVRIHVMKDDLPGKAATFAAGASRWGWVASMGRWAQVAELIQGAPTAFAQDSLSNSFGDVCAVYIKTDMNGLAEEKKRQVEAQSGGRITFASPLAAAERRAVTMLHEAAHCGRDNRALPYGILREGHADLVAAEALARAWGPGMREKVLRQRLMFDGSRDHDTALYLDAAFRGAARPSAEEMYAANAQAANVLAFEKAMDKSGAEKGPQVAMSCSGGGKEPVNCEMPPPLSALARRRVELWREHRGAMLRAR